MSRMVFSEVVGTMSFLRPQCDDDSVDRLHYYYTTTFLLVFAVLISLKMFGGSPIECWLPAEFRPSWQEYTELICWSMSTYFVRGALGGGPNGGQLKEPNETDRRHQTIAYYQWTPFFLVFSAILFYSPCVVWRKLSAKSGLVLNEIVGFAMAVDKCPTVNNLPARAAKLRGIAAHLGSAFRHRSRRRQNSMSSNFGPLNFWHFWGEELRFHPSYLASLYMAIKLLFLAIVLLQAILMNRFLQTDSYDFYGFGVLQDLLHGREWSDSGFFPRIAFCDIDVRILGSVQKYTVQCILVINIFTEKVFVLLWCWYSLLLMITILNGLEWLMAISSFQARREFVLRRLKLADMEFEEAKCGHRIDRFIRDFLKIDGCFVLRMLDVHTGEWVCAEIVDLIWEEYCGNEKEKLEADTLAAKAEEEAPSEHSHAHSGEEEELPPKEKPRKKKAKRPAKKCCLLQPLVARPTPEEEQQLGFGGWASLPNLLWNSPPIHRAIPPFPSASPPFNPPPYPLPRIGQRPQLRRAESVEGTSKRHKLRPSNSFDQSSSTRHSGRFGGIGQRTTDFMALRKNSDIREEEEEQENEEFE